MQFLLAVCWLLLLNLCVPIIGQAQTNEYENLNVEELRKKAERQHELGDWYSAIQSYEAAYQKAQNTDASPETQYELASTLAKLNRKIRNYQEAGFYYQTLAMERSGAYPKARFYAALMVQQQGLYDSAKKLLNQVKERYQGGDAYTVKKRVEAALKGTKKAIEQGVESDTAQLTHLNPSVNSAYSEFSPLLLNDTTLLYASRKVDSLIEIKRGGKVSHHTRFYTAQFREGEWNHQGPWEDGPTDKANLGNGAFSQDRKRFYFTRCQFSKAEQEMICKLYEAQRKNGQWTNFRKLPEPVNLDGVSSTHPATVTITKGRKKQAVLIFASDRERGRGKMDIWYSTYDSEDGDYSRPRNMGRKVNTKGNEVTPFFDTATGTLFFSSDSRPGYGGLDVYGVSGDFGRFREDSRHLGAPVNSPADDLYYWIKGDHAGFVVSNRVGVRSIKHPTCCDDLFATQLPSRDSARKPLLAKKLNGKVLKQDTSLKASAQPEKDSTTVVRLYHLDTAKGSFRVATADTFSVSDSSSFQFRMEDLSAEAKIYVEAQETGYQGATSDTFQRQQLKQGATHTRLVLKREQVVAEKQQTKETQTAEADQSSGQTQLKDTQRQTQKRQNRTEVKKEETDTALTASKKEDEKSEDETTIESEEKSTRDQENKPAKSGKGPVVIPNVNYAFDEARLNEKAKDAIDTTVLDLMKRKPDVKVQIRSHTDNAGSEEYNLDLSQRRAEKVVEYLVQKGIDRERLVPKGFGERKHIAPNFKMDGSDNPEGRQKNRRTEFKILN